MTQTRQEAMAYLKIALQGVEADIHAARLVKNAANTHCINQHIMFTADWADAVQRGSQYLEKQPISKIRILTYRIRRSRATLRLIAAGVSHKEAESRAWDEVEEILGPMGDAT